MNTSFAMLLLSAIVFASGYVLGKRDYLASKARITALENAFREYEKSVQESLEWTGNQIHHSTSVDKIVQKIREVAILYEVGKIDEDEASMRFEMLRAEGQVHFDELDEKLRMQYIDEVERLGSVVLFRSGEE